MYYPFFAVYIIVGCVVSLVVVSWAIRSGQFRDQQRARFLPLEVEPEGETPTPTGASSYEIYALGFIAAAGLLTSGALLVFSLVSGGG
jgi:hypothetical protein